MGEGDGLRWSGGGGGGLVFAGGCVNLVRGER